MATAVGTEQKGDRDIRVQQSGVWDRRPALSRAVRVAVFAGPIIGSLGVAALLSRLLPRADSLAMGVLWAAVIMAGSLLTLVALERAARQLLPLAALLNLALTFPDKAPRRFAVARRTGKPADLQAQLQRAHAAGNADEAERMQTVIELVLALSIHDKASRGHSERVRVFTDLLADELNVPDGGRNRLRWAALLHDVGKLEVAPAILNKPGKPTDEEWVSLHRHPEEGARLVGPLLQWLGEWGLAVVQHHERFDGTGYPHRLKGPEISLAARIVAVADSYEVMTAPRAYKRPMSVAAAKQELVRGAGTQFDPVIVRAFLNVSVGRLWRTIGFGAWIAQIPALSRLFSFGGMAGPGMGIASAATATVLAVSGIVGPAPARPVGGSSVTASLPSQGATPAMPNTQPSGSASAPAVTGASTFGPSPTAGSGPPAGVPTSPATATRTPAPTPRPTATPRPAPTPTPTPAPTSTPTSTPAPTPDPWSCAGCTNTAAGCTSYCSGSKNKNCVANCTGNDNKVCLFHCFGGGKNDQCLQYCDGNDPRCQQFCNGPGGAAVAVAAVEVPAPLILASALTRARRFSRLTHLAEPLQPLAPDGGGRGLAAWVPVVAGYWLGIAASGAGG